MILTGTPAFADSAPNVSLIGHLERGAEEEEAVVLTLLSATYDAAASTLTYEVMLLDAELITDVAFEHEPVTVLDAPHEYAEASLFIDEYIFLANCQICYDKCDDPRLSPDDPQTVRCMQQCQMIIGVQEGTCDHSG